MADDVMLQEAVEAVRQGQRVRARDLLTRLLRANQRNPIYWLWMSSVVETTNEQVYCLQSVERLDPGNSSARQGMILLGAISPGDAVMPVPPVQREWKVELQEIHEVGRVRAFLGNPVVRVILVILVALTLFGAAGVYFFNWSQPQETQRIAIKPTRTRGVLPTLTATPTPVNFTPTPPTPTPTFEGNVPPLWLGLEATYTPTPMYVATMHLTNEAYNTGMRFFEEGDFEEALARMEQAVRMEPTAPDIHFYLGEIHMAMGEHQKAYSAYKGAIQRDPEFAPAHLGRARALLAINPENVVFNDLDKAIDLDPNLLQAYVLRIEAHLDDEDLESALDDLQALEDLAPDYAPAALSRARFHIAQGDYEAAQEVAETAIDLDQTLLPAYLALGEAALLNEDYEAAVEALEIYMAHAEDDPQSVVLYGKALYAADEFEDTLTVMAEALELDEDLAEAYYYRGLVFIEEDEGQKAVNEIILARNLDRYSFAYSLALGRALLGANRLAEARDQITAASRLAESDEEMAQVHYYRALTIEKIGNQPSADKEWEALLELPREAVPRAWLRSARARLATPTPTETEAPTPTPKPTD